MMKKSFKFMTATAIALLVFACGSPKKMAQQAENVTVTCTPEVLEVVAGKITATVSVTYPAKYFNAKAILKVTPVIVYDGGEAAAEPLYFQGEKVKDNYEVVPSAGSTVTKTITFDYVPGMEKCYLELRGVASIKTKTADLPVKKVADGANTTYMLACTNGKVDLMPDAYQETINETVEGQILYLINSADVRGSQLKSKSIKDYQEALKEILDNERKKATATDIIAYASPDGGEKLNAKLSDNRAKTAKQAFKTITKKIKIDAPINIESIGQDWEGFKELVNASDLEDKDLIIRVLSMYEDPATRENEIKNMSALYTELTKDVLPALRRARFVTTSEFTNYTAEELLKENIELLDEEALLRVATLVEDKDAKIKIYQKAADTYGSARAKYNIAALYLNAGETSKGKAAFEEVTLIDADCQNALGVIALQEGDLAEASKRFAAAGNETANQNQGIVDLLNGDYVSAASRLANSDCCCNKALAYLLAGDPDAAAAAVKCECPKGAYIKAIVAARKGDAEGVKANLEKASKCEKLAERAAKDIEFAQFN